MAKEKYTEKQLEKMSVEELRLLNKEDYTQQDLEKLSVEELRYILGDDFIGIPDGDFVLLFYLVVMYLDYLISNQLYILYLEY